MADVGEILFREVLGMTTYPGSPFTGELFRDIILFFFVPSVFLIIFIYVTSSIVIAPSNRRLHLLMALALYAFIIASRYFEGFAIFASQFYFLFLILLGAIYFMGRHFRPGGGRMAYDSGGGRMSYDGGNGGGRGNSGGHDGGSPPRAMHGLIAKSPDTLDDKDLRDAISELEHLAARDQQGRYSERLEEFRAVAHYRRKHPVGKYMARFSS